MNQITYNTAINATAINGASIIFKNGGPVGSYGTFGSSSTITMARPKRKAYILFAVDKHMEKHKLFYTKNSVFHNEYDVWLRGSLIGRVWKSDPAKEPFANYWMSERNGQRFYSSTRRHATQLLIHDMGLDSLVSKK